MKVSGTRAESAFWLHNPIPTPGNLYSFLRCISVADKQLGNRWQYRSLTPAEQDAVVLPEHRHPLRAKPPAPELIGPDGLTAQDTARWLFEHPEYRHTNPKCWQKLNYVMDHVEVIYVSREPINMPTYEQMQGFGEDHLYHLDGLHTLVAQALLRRLDDERGQRPIPAYIAG